MGEIITILEVWKQRLSNLPPGHLLGGRHWVGDGGKVGRWTGALKAFGLLMPYAISLRSARSAKLTFPGGPNRDLQVSNGGEFINGTTQKKSIIGQASGVLILVILPIFIYKTSFLWFMTYSVFGTLDTLFKIMTTQF